MATLAAPDNESAHAMTGSLTSSPLPQAGEGEFVAPSAHFHVRISARALRPDRGGCRMVGEGPAFAPDAVRRYVIEILALLCVRPGAGATQSCARGASRGSAADLVLPLPSRVGKYSGSDRLAAHESKSTTVRVLNRAPPNPRSSGRGEERRPSLLAWRGWAASCERRLGREKPRPVTYAGHSLSVQTPPCTSTLHRVSRSDPSDGRRCESIANVK
jgi:hypothetical protein